MRHIQHMVTWAGVAALVAAGSVSPASAEQQPATSFIAAQAAQVHQVTLITGDVVAYRKTANGLQTATVDPAEDGGRKPGFMQTTENGDLYVIPDDVGPYLTKGRLDRELFNVTDLVEDGYDDDSRTSLPLIVTYGARTRSVPAVARRTRTLTSINGDAVTVGKANAEKFWDVISDRGAALTGGVQKIWLDRPVKVTLDQSVPQIGAPKAWSAGFDGKGVPVAVLDTGIDLTHPDLKGKVLKSANFTTEPDISDGHGHGTHVASTLTGTGTASSGLRKGVAPGADLYIGKVLPKTGSAPGSQIIAGMEWAASTGARVISISIGGGPTDGTDPMSQAVNRLTASSGALFVIAAGNDGASVSSPGAADAALTVGAVTKTDQLADFSGRGPRLGDYAVKPDITAPGVDIGAARAAGTSMGSPIDTYYTRASGTSMATPHVAGAAALLAQQHPNWRAEQLKAALISTARQDGSITVNQQGGGRVDVGRAVTQKLMASPATLSFFYDWPHANPEPKPEKAITYSNSADTPVELTLTATLAGPDGAPSPAVALSSTHVTVPAGGSATVTATFDPNAAATGHSTGYINATASDGKVVHTTLGLYKEPEMVNVTVPGIARDGRPAAFGQVILWRYDAGGPYGQFQLQAYASDGAALKFRVPPGRYTLMANIATMDSPGVYVVEMTTLGRPDLEVRQDQTVVLDARPAKEITVATPKESEPQGFTLGWHREVNGRMFSGSYTLNEFTDRAFAVPTERAVGGSFEFFSRWRKYAPAIRARALGRRPLDVHLEHMGGDGVPHWNGRGVLRAVSVGAGRSEDYAGTDLRGRVAVVQRTAGVAFATQLAGAVKSGARAIILVWDRPGVALAWAGSTPIPAFTIGQAEGRQLIQRSPAPLEMRGTSASPYVYDLLFPEKGAIPADLSYTVSNANTARVDTTFHGQVAGRTIGENRNGVRPYGFVPIEFLRQVPAPFGRTEWLSANDTQWWQQSYAQLPFTGTMLDTPRSYQAGQHLSTSWWKQVARTGSPDAPVGSSAYAWAGQPAFRTGNEMVFTIPEFNDAGVGHSGLSDPRLDKGLARLYRNGTLVGEVPRLLNARAEVPAESASYKLTSDVTRTAPWWTMSTALSTAWTFTSGNSPGTTYLPLLQVDFDIAVDTLNQAPPGAAFPIQLFVRHQPGVANAPAIAGAKVWTSTDDGNTWTAATVSGSKGRYTTTVNQSSAAFVSLRVEAWDAAGNRIDQTIKRAYAVK